MVKTEDEQIFRIFISHKQIDHKLAIVTKETLEDLGGKNQVECFVSGVDIPAGNDWNQVIKEELNQSNLLLLLFTNPTKDWDWCLYEAGLFTKFDKTRVTSVVCIYNPDATPPSPLNNLQGIPARVDKIESFLTRLVKETSEIVDNWADQKALNPRVTNSKLAESATAICRGFQLEATYHPCHRMVLDMSFIPQEEIGDQIPESALVVEGLDGTSAFTLSIFGCAIGPKKHTWGELLDNLDAREELWRTQLDKAFAGGRRESLFDPVSATLHSWQEKRLYKPVLYRIVHTRESIHNQVDATARGKSRPVQITIVFEHVFAPTPVGDPLFNLIRTYTRFRIELFEEFCGRLAELAYDSDTRSLIVDRLLSTVRLIESESDAYNLYDATNIRAAFGDDKVDDFQEMKRRWLTARRQFDQVLSDPRFLDDDISRVEELLDEMQSINRACLIRATERSLKILNSTA